MESLNVHNSREREREGERERERESKHTTVNSKTLRMLYTSYVFSEHFYTSLDTDWQKYWQVLQCSFMSPYTYSQIYSLWNICLMASWFSHQSGLSYAPVCVPVYAFGLTDRSKPIRSSASSADPADFELVSQQHQYPCPSRYCCIF